MDGNIIVTLAYCDEIICTTSYNTMLVLSFHLRSSSWLAPEIRCRT